MIRRPHRPDLPSFPCRFDSPFGSIPRDHSSFDSWFVDAGPVPSPFEARGLALIAFYLHLSARSASIQRLNLLSSGSPRPFRGSEHHASRRYSYPRGSETSSSPRLVSRSKEPVESMALLHEGGKNRSLAWTVRSQLLTEARQQLPSE